MLETLGNVVLYSIEDTEVREWDIPAETTLLRVSLPSNPENSAAMFKRGYLLGDRTILCTIPTRNLPDNLGKSVRVKATLENADHDAMFELSRSSFLGDRRFYVTPDCRQDIADIALKKWIGNLDETFVCRVKNEYAGFLAPTLYSHDSLCVNLAATNERFRLAGVAVSLYTSAICLAHERGLSRLVGRISSRNMAVMNLYANLGAKFSDPLDIYIKEVR